MNEYESEKGETQQDEQDHVSTSKGPSIRVHKKHLKDLIIGNLDQGITTRRSNEVISSSCFVSKLAVGVCARYQAEPKMSHLTQVKRILKYINSTSGYGIMYSHSENSMLIGYYDAEWAGSADDRKITSGGCFFMGNNLISWFSKKKNCVSYLLLKLST